MKTETTPKAETESRTRIQAYSKSQLAGLYLLTYSPPRHDAPSVVGLPRTLHCKPHSLKPDIVKKPSCSLRHK